MVNSVSQSQITPKTTRTSIFYINDIHSNVPNIERLKTASDEFDAFVPSEKTDKLKFSAGDFCAGVNVNSNRYNVFAQNKFGIMATAAGNHEFDPVKKDVIDILAKNEYKILGLNVEIPEDSQENSGIKSELTKSYIQEQNGTKYGIVGLLPFDFGLHATHPKMYSDFDVLPLEKTIPALQSEIDKMKEQGVNKIIVLSHAGYEADKQIAQSVEGIDVILGGHTHNLLEGVEEGKNLFYSKTTGAPTVITQAEKDGKYFGVLNLEFDENGVIKTVQNNVVKTADFPRSRVMAYFSDMFFGKPQIIGTINSAEDKGAPLNEENPTANFICDSLKNELGTDIAILNAGGLRESVKPGPITDRNVAELSPFKNRACIVKITEEELVNAIKVGAKSMTHPAYMPGLVQVSGVKYTVTKSGELKNLAVIDKNGNSNIIDINNPNPSKTYTVGTDSYVARGGNGLLPDKSKEKVKDFDFDKINFTVDYIKKLTAAGEPIDVKTDGRIQIVNGE